MKIREVTITARRPDAAAAFYRDVLQMPVQEHPDGVRVVIGSSRLSIVPGEQFDGVHHLAFGISPHDFDFARTWLNQRIELIVAGDSEVVEGSAGWNSRSVYFLGPEDILLEFIARDADADRPAGAGVAPRPLSISEVGIGVPDVETAVHELTDGFGLPRFPPQETHFAPVGDHDGLLIVVDQERIWFPTRMHRSARGPLAARLQAPHPGRVAVTNETTITGDSAA